MGKSKKHKNAGKAQSKKNPAQLNAYKSFLSNPQNQPEDTVDIRNENLTGSNILQISEDSASHAMKPRPVPFKVRAKRFWESNGIWGIIITLLITFGTWTVISIHQNDVAIERLSVRLDYIEKSIDALDTDGINADELHNEIEDIKVELEASWELDIKDIENRISIIELLIDNLESKIE